MNDRTRAIEAGSRVADLFAAQQLAFEAHPFPTLPERREHLRALKRQVVRYQDVLADAMHRDFGGRSPTGPAPASATTTPPSRASARPPACARCSTTPSPRGRR